MVTLQKAARDLTNHLNYLNTWLPHMNAHKLANWAAEYRRLADTFQAAADAYRRAKGGR